MEKKEMYLAPEVEVLEVKVEVLEVMVEKGFAGSEIGEGGQTPPIEEGPF